MWLLLGGTAGRRGGGSLLGSGSSSNQYLRWATSSCVATTTNATTLSHNNKCIATTTSFLQRHGYSVFSKATTTTTTATTTSSSMIRPGTTQHHQQQSPPLLLLQSNNLFHSHHHVFPSLHNFLGIRTMALTKKDEYKRKALLRKLKIQGAPKPKPKPDVTESMKTWAEFQRAIAVPGYDTGQITEAKRVQRNRGGRAARKRKLREIEQREAAVSKKRVVVAGGGRYPATRLSEDETAALLAKAYAGLPQRTGPRGNRRRHRQKRRWFLVRKIHAKIKRYRIRAHFRRMAKRSANVKSVLAVKAIVPDTKVRDAAYQEEVLQKWLESVTQGMGGIDAFKTATGYSGIGGGSSSGGGMGVGEIIQEGELVQQS